MVSMGEAGSGVLIRDRRIGARAPLLRARRRVGERGLAGECPAGVLRALAGMIRDRDPRVRRAAQTILTRRFEALSPLERSESIGRLATSTRPELRLLVALALRHGPIVVGGLSALELLVDDVDPEVRRAALVSLRLRAAEAPGRLMALVRRKVAELDQA
jgi:hypothetical protein